MTHISDRQWLSAFALLMFALACVPLLGTDSTVTSFRDILLFCLFALGLDLFWGRTGILSFGHATFFGLGAYGMALASNAMVDSPMLRSLAGLVCGMGVATLLGFAVAYFLIRGQVRGAYFTITTLALSLIAQQIAIGWSNVTGGDAGIIGIPPLGLGGYSLTGLYPQYGFVLLILFAVALALWLKLRGHTGVILRAIEDSEVKAETLGYETSSYLVNTFTVSAAISSLAGAIYAGMTGFVAPDMIGLALSTEVIMWVAVGGRGLIIGPIVGTLLLWQMQQRISSLSSSAWPLFMGLFFIVMVFAFPNGLASLWETLMRKIKS